MSRTLKTGVAYHGNRMPSHVMADMREIARADMDIVVHMLSHIDWERHGNVMKDIFAITEDAGLEVWVDNWGLGGAPGDRSHFLAAHPEAHTYYNTGEMNPYIVCLNSPDYRQFVKDWLYAVVEMGGKTVFWDEPHIPTKRTDGGRIFCCCCPTCQNLFEEKYGHPMPRLEMTPEMNEFREDTIAGFFREITDYSASLGVKNTSCVMPGPHHGIGIDSFWKLGDLPHMDGLGYDPYWFHKKDIESVYKYVYDETKKLLEVSKKYNKEHNLWIQGYASPRGREEEIIEATEAAYDAGARCILSWSFHGAESNNYRSENPERSWDMTVEAMKRIRSMERDRILAENRAKYMK